ncbi:hypothetical protein TNCV_3219341, partial [Trichonephila clavipes]
WHAAKASSLRAQAQPMRTETCGLLREKREQKKTEKPQTHIDIREAEDWFRPIDLAKECDIYISSRSPDHVRKFLLLVDIPKTPLKIDHETLNQIQENYPQNLERENKNCYICGDSSHYARDCGKAFKPKESNSHIHNRINVNTLKVESEKTK